MRSLAGLVASAAIVAACSGGGGHHAARPTTTRASSHARGVSTTAPTTTSTAPAPISATSTTRFHRLVVASDTTTTEAPLDCHNSHDPRCGEFRWEGIVNQPATIEAQVANPPAVAGSSLTLRIHYVDDSVVGCVTLLSGEVPSDAYVPFGDCGLGNCRFGTDPSDFGPWWLPPKPTDVTFDRVIRGNFVAGHYRITLEADNRNCVSLVGEKPDPYDSEATTVVEFDVVTPPTTTTTT